METMKFSNPLSTKFKLLALPLILVVSSLPLQAQTAIATTGGDASGSGGSSSYTIGQVLYTTEEGTGGSLAQGAQHPFEIFIVSFIEGTSGIDLLLAAYPNPVTDMLALEVRNFSHSALSYHLYNMDGKLLENKKIENNKAYINMGHLTASTYVLVVFDGTKEIKTFKIVKY